MKTSNTTTKLIKNGNEFAITTYTSLLNLTKKQQYERDLNNTQQKIQNLLAFAAHLSPVTSFVGLADREQE